MLKKYDTIKIAFFKEEGNRMRGQFQSIHALFQRRTVCHQPDRKGNSDLITNISFSELCSDEFIEAVKPEEWGYKENNRLIESQM